MDIVLPKIETVDEVVASVKKEIVDTTGFELTDAVCPINEFGLWAGFQRATYFDQVSGVLQVVIINETKSLLFDLFTDLAEELLKIEKVKRSCIDVVLESRHIPDDKTGFGKKYDCCDRAEFFTDFVASHVDPVSFLSKLFDFEDLIMNDGFTGVSLLAIAAFCELRLDVHKVISVFSKRPNVAERMAAFLKKRGVAQLPIQAHTVAEKPHVHIGHSNYKDRFDQFVESVGAQELA